MLCMKRIAQMRLRLTKGCKIVGTNFQNYDFFAQRKLGPSRLQALRKCMLNYAVTAFHVPHADEHQNEYLPERAERLAWLTGFTGSAGFAIATLETCVVFVDGRYTLQVKDQIDQQAFEPQNLTDNPPSKWIAEHASEDDTIGYDPWLITADQFEKFEKAVKKTGATLKPVPNLIDEIWENQPVAPTGPVAVQSVTFAGKSTEEKVKELSLIHI